MWNLASIKEVKDICPMVLSLHKHIPSLHTADGLSEGEVSQERMEEARRVNSCIHSGEFILRREEYLDEP
jgi:hypothetical protein